MGDAGLRQRGAEKKKSLKVLPGRSATGATSEHAEPQDMQAEAAKLVTKAEAQYGEIQKVPLASPPPFSALPDVSHARLRWLTSLRCCWALGGVADV